MTQKELLYLEDACGHEDSIISIIDESLNYLEDEELITFMNNELERHRNIKSELIGLLECVSNSDDSNNDDEDYERVSHAFAEVSNEFVTGDAASDSGLPAYSLPEVKFRYSDILFSDYEEIKVSEALGRVSMEAAAKCPPAILPIVPGEVINEDVIKILNFYGIKTIRVRI